RRRRAGSRRGRGASTRGRARRGRARARAARASLHIGRWATPRPRLPRRVPTRPPTLRRRRRAGAPSWRRSGGPRSRAARPPSSRARQMRESREVLFVDGVRPPFGKAGPKGQYWRTRADDMAVKAVREVLRRNPEIEPERIGDVVLAATAQVGDQGLTLGRDV